MNASLPTLDYDTKPVRDWRRILRRTLVVILLLLMLAGLAWLASITWAARTRYRIQSEWQAGAAALSAYSIPPGTVVIDPAAGPVTYQKPYKTANSHGWWLALKIPRDPVQQKHLMRVGRLGDFPSAVAIATELQTGRGKSFVSSFVVVRDLVGGSQVMYISESEEQLHPGRFPTYRYTINGFLSSIHIRAWGGQPLPTVLAGQVDSAGKSWTLPLIVNGKQEWVRFDHSGAKWPVVTASFGKLTSGGSQWNLDY